MNLGTAQLRKRRFACCAVLTPMFFADLLAGLPCAGEEAAASRASCLERYREKKLRRLECPTIRYMKRKINADSRPRDKVPPPSPPLARTHPPAAHGCLGALRLVV